MTLAERAREVVAAWKRADDVLPPMRREVLLWSRDLLIEHVAGGIAAKERAEWERDAAHAEVTRLRAALGLHGKHTVLCGIRCSCGLDAALALVPGRNP